MQTHSRAALSQSFATNFLARDADAWGAQTRDPAIPTPELGHASFRILIVNEDMRSADCLKQTLFDLGYTETLTAYSAKRALVAAKDFSPAVALLDLELPDMTGYRLAQMFRVHADRHVRRLRLVAVAERNEYTTDQLARAAGFVGLLTKPVAPSELNGLLRGL